MISGRVTGQAELRHVQALIRTTPQRMIAQIAVALRPELRKVQPEVKAEAAGTLPKRGGYATIMAGSVGATTSVRVAGDSVNARVRVSAKGKREERDVAAVNRGRLRHPTRGTVRRRRADWVWDTTRVPPGFVTRVISRTEDRAERVAKEARDDAADRIVRG